MDEVVLCNTSHGSFEGMFVSPKYHNIDIIFLFDVHEFFFKKRKKKKRKRKRKERIE